MARNDTSSLQKPNADQLQKIITDIDSGEILVRAAENIGTALARQLTTNQIRAIFGEVRRIEGAWKTNAPQAQRSLILLKPKMAYRARKERGRAVGDLVDILSPAIDYVGKSEANFSRFVDFFEAILAYHKAAGGN